MHMKVVLIGSGNVASVLGRMVHAKGHHILQVISRNMAHAHTLAMELGAQPVTDFRKLDHRADISIIAVSDEALSSVNLWLHAGDNLVVHTAGSVSREVLKNSSPKYGVLYPLQSLRKENKELPEVPFLIDGNTNEVISSIRSFAQTISNRVSIATDYDRLRLHLAAVTTSNFMNHLFTLTESFCHKEGVDFSLLIPLLSETVNRLASNTPGSMQTGPAIRNDRETIQKHISMLSEYPELEKIYELLTKSITDYHSNHKHSG
jgi:predicted short-subunit dehydrogenase-like oxidoreductase (DUF2520 family)